MDENKKQENEEKMQSEQPKEEAQNEQSSQESALGADKDMQSETMPQGKSETTVIVSGGATASSEYASFLQRLVAGIIDAFIFALIGMLIGFVFGDDNPLGSLAGVLYWIYAVYMLVNYGATLGKMAVGIKVQDINTGENLDYVGAILREVVGKFLSWVVFLLGYLWMLWDNEKQCWHDKLAKSIVVKAK